MSSQSAQNNKRQKKHNKEYLNELINIIDRMKNKLQGNGIPF